MSPTWVSWNRFPVCQGAEIPQKVWLFLGEICWSTKESVTPTRLKLPLRFPGDCHEHSPTQLLTPAALLRTFLVLCGLPWCRLSFKHRPDSRFLPPPVTSNPGLLLQCKGWSKDKKRPLQGLPTDPPPAHVCFVKTEMGMSWEGVWLIHFLV